MAQERDRQVAEAVEREGSRLLGFIRRRVPDEADAEDVLQEVLYELVEANRLLMPIEHLSGWLFRVARNRIVDLFRRKKPLRLDDVAAGNDPEERLGLEELLPSEDAGPEAIHLRHVLLDELETAIDELPPEQREVFVAHEIDGRSFKEVAAASGVNLNTLLSRKRYAVHALRERLQDVYDAYLDAGRSIR